MLLNQFTISELTARLAKREVSAREAMQSCLDQIARVDKTIHAFISYKVDLILLISCLLEHCLKLAQNVPSLNPLKVSIARIITGMKAIVLNVL